MNIISPDTKLIIINDEKRTATLATVRTYDTETCLYYIPVKPVFKLLKEDKRHVELFLSVFAYLYQIAGVGYHGNNSSYLYYAYDAVEKWTEEAQEDWDEDEYSESQLEIRAHKFVASAIKRRIKHPYQLSSFEERVNGFVPSDDFHSTLLEIASRCLQLYKDYPERKIDDTVFPNLCASEEEESISVEQYLSFFWSGKGFLYDQVVEYVNSSLQELSAIDEPTSIQFFDTPQTAISHEFYFEERFFKLLTDLIDLLISME